MKARKVEGLDPSAPLGPNAARIVQTRLEELRALGDLALAPGASEAQHDMRIAAKRLRYVLEIVAPCFGEEAGVARKVAKELQTALGDLHDCDLMLARIEGIESLEAVLRARRDSYFHRFVELWQGAASNGIWAALESAMGVAS